MIPKGVYTPLGIIACPLQQYRTHRMIPRGLHTLRNHCVPCTVV